MTGVEHGFNSAVYRCADLAIGRLDGNAVAQQAFREGGIGDFRDGHSLTGYGGVNVIEVDFFLLAEQFVKQTHKCFLLSL